MLLREVNRKIKLLGRLSARFTDKDAADQVKHPLSSMLAQRPFGLALSYEDLNEHEQLRLVPLFAILAGKRDLEQPQAGRSTINRLELAGLCEQYYKIGYSPESND